MTLAADTGQGPPGAGPLQAQAAPKGLYFVRRVTAMQDFEVFFVSSVATILIVRSILAATGWPQLGGGKIHFAHLLWGGIGMLLAFILFMAMQGRLWDFLATLSAGIGFGLFLDELGKFITSDNDYFFRPAVAIMYVLFVVLFFVFRALGRVDRMGPETALVNSFDYAKEAVMRAMDRGERERALAVLAQADQADPMVKALSDVLGGDPTAEGAAADTAQKLWGRIRAWWARLVGARWFRRFILGWFIFTSVAALLGPVALAVDPTAMSGMEIGGLIAGAVTGACVVVGLVRWRASRLAAYRWFERGALVAILVGEFFSFYENQITAVFGLVWLLVQLGVIRSMIAVEGVAAPQHNAAPGGA